MAIASPAMRTTRPRPAAARRLPEVTAERLRDELTRDRLAAAVSHLPGLQMLEFSSDWWDGQTHVPCLVVRGGRRSRRLRVVETTGVCVIVPFARRTAQRWLAARRRPGRAEAAGRQAAPAAVRLDATVDTVRCRTRSCGALLPVGYEGACPLCGA